MSSITGRIALLAAIGFFCVPLFIGLRGWDLRNDEAIYSYSVDRIVETGQWATPRMVPYDDNFLEKPPLKFWLVAGAIRAGLLPHDEFGLRFIDAVFGAIAFLYVFVMGRRLAGPLCGLGALLVLFTIDSLLFEHGIRGNHMEAALLLSYCGGIYHFARWVEGATDRRQRLHPIAAGVYFALGFMTKFVAVFFLPLVCVIGLAWRDEPLKRLRDGWRDWLSPFAVALAIIAPWFIYEAIIDGAGLWRVMVSEHVVTRFTGVLDPRHQEPWHYYFSHLWLEISQAGSQWIVALGVAMLAVRAWQGRPWLTRLLLVWWLVPFVMMSFGTSKVFHYAFPFLPPVALGAGMALAALFTVLNRWILRAGAVAGHALRDRIPRLDSLLVTRTRIRQLLLVAALFSVGLSIWAFLAGRVVWKIGGVQLLKNTSSIRPLVMAAILLGLGRHTRLLSRGLAMAALLLVLPIATYDHKLYRARTQDHPLRTLRDCARGLSGPRHSIQMFPLYEELITHTDYYYLRTVAPWTYHDRHATSADFQRLLFVPEEQALAIVLRRDYDAFKQEFARGQMGPGRLPVSIALQDDIVLLTPGPYEPCGLAAIAATERQIGEIPKRETAQ